MLPNSAAALLALPALRASGDLQELPDDQLLAQFFESQDEAAFAVLLARHGPLVLGVCRRILGNSSDADDAFQATFLVLVSKGRTLRDPGQLASWLYGVASRTARKLKSKAVLRQKRERQAIPMTPTFDARDMTYGELQAILDEEISRLPAKYALPLVMCYLEGKTNAQAAAQLGWPEGSMSRRLSRARELLRSRLARRGLALSVALIAYAFARKADAAAPSLAAATLQNSRRVAKGESIRSVVASSASAAVAMTAASATSKVAVSTLAIVVIAATTAIIAWQVGAPAAAANRTNAPHGFWGTPASSSSLSPATGGCGALE